MAITAAQVNELRQKTGVGLMDCKKALVAANGDMEAAMENLRKSGIAKADKKAGRAANDGLFVSIIDGKVAVAVEVLCETDFVARTDDFQKLAADIAKTALALDAEGDISAALNEKCGEAVKVLIGKLGENMQIRRAVRWTTNGAFRTYKHHQGGPFYGVLVDVEGEYNDELLDNLCMHITANAPAYIAPKDVPAEIIEHEKEIAKALPDIQEKIKKVPNPEKMLAGILNGKINKWYSQVCLLEQPWIDDEKTTLSKVAPKLVVKRFIRWTVGEEIK